MDAFDLLSTMLLSLEVSIQELRKASDKLKEKHATGQTISSEDVLAILSDTKRLADEIRARVAANDKG